MSAVTVCSRPLARHARSVSSMVLTLAPIVAFGQTPPPPSPATPPAPLTQPTLVTAAVKQQGGWRASKTIGSEVYNDQNQRIGTIDDLILSAENTVQFAIISVGGFLGIGSKLIGVPYDQIHFEQDKNTRKAVLANASKEALNAQPSFTYAE